MRADGSNGSNGAPGAAAAAAAAVEAIEEEDRACHEELAGMHGEMRALMVELFVAASAAGCADRAKFKRLSETLRASQQRVAAGRAKRGEALRAIAAHVGCPLESDFGSPGCPDCGSLRAAAHRDKQALQALRRRVKNAAARRSAVGEPVSVLALQQDLAKIDEALAQVERRRGPVCGVCRSSSSSSPSASSSADAPPPAPAAALSPVVTGPAKAKADQSFDRLMRKIAAGRTPSPAKAQPTPSPAPAPTPTEELRQEDPRPCTPPDGGRLGDRSDDDIPFAPCSSPIADASAAELSPGMSFCFTPARGPKSPMLPQRLVFQESPAAGRAPVRVRPVPLPAAPAVEPGPEAEAPAEGPTEHLPPNHVDLRASWKLRQGPSTPGRTRGAL